MNSICPMNFFRTTDTTDTTIWKPGFNSFTPVDEVIPAAKVIDVFSLVLFSWVIRENGSITFNRSVHTSFGEHHF